MTRVEFKKKLSLVVIIVTAMTMLSCIAAIPVAVMYYKEANEPIAKAESLCLLIKFTRLRSRWPRKRVCR